MHRLFLRRTTHDRPEAVSQRHGRARVRSDYRRLVDRVNRRFYPETIPVLVSYWLKTIYWNGYGREEWRELDRLLRRESRLENLSEPWREAVADLRSWIHESQGQSRKKAEPADIALAARRPALPTDAIVGYATRLLNDWLPQEIATLLVREPESGVPAHTVARALERLLVRDRLSIFTLEALLDPGLLSAGAAYPADVEILRDVILFLLGRTEAPAPVALPATLLAVAPGAQFPADYGDCVSMASLAGGEIEELHVPISQGHAARLLAEPLARIGSLVVTGDGRCWEAERLEEAGRSVIVYRPQSRLRLDYSRDHVRLRIPWPEERMSWAGAMRFPQALEMFGRLWRVAAWERDSNRSWAHLVFAGALSVSGASQGAPINLRRSSPAFQDMAWAEMGAALNAAADRKEWAPIEHLQRDDLIPLGRALFGLTQALKDRRLGSAGFLETYLNRVQYVQAGTLPLYGRIPWRILPVSLRKGLMRKARTDGALRDVLTQVFSDVPPASASAPALGSLAWLARHRGAA